MRAPTVCLAGCLVQGETLSARAERIVQLFLNLPIFCVCPQMLISYPRFMLVLQHVTHGPCGVLSPDLVSWMGMSVRRRLWKDAVAHLSAVTLAGRRYAVC